MRVKSFALGLVAAVGLFALSGSHASAQYVRPYYGGGTYYYPAPPVVYRPVYVAPTIPYPAYGGGYGYARPGVSFGYSSGYRPYGGYYGGGPRYHGGSGFSFGFNIR